MACPFGHAYTVPPTLPGALLPVLQTYLGHSSIGDTAYYLHLTAESYPDITAA